MIPKPLNARPERRRERAAAEQSTTRPLALSGCAAILGNMSLQPAMGARSAVVYPDSDGEPMAENTLQCEWIMRIKGNLDACFPDVFVGADLFWYPVEGDPHTRVAPDVLVAPGRPKGHRGSYMQWVEAGLPPKVVFEIWSPSNSFPSQLHKLQFYDRHGVDEFYGWDPERKHFSAFLREGGELKPVATEGEFTSPVLGVRFVLGDDLQVFRPDGTPFLSFAELDEVRIKIAQERDAATQERDAATQERDAATQERDAAAQERDAATQERDAATQERDAALRRAESLAAKLRAAGIEPE